MRLTFQLRFHTNFGQTLFLTGNHSLMGNGDFAKAIPLKYVDSEFWLVSLDLDKAAIPDREITYNYILRLADGEQIWDWGRDRRINLAQVRRTELFIIDSWNHAGFFENVFYTEPFKTTLLRAHRTGPEAPSSTSQDHTHLFKVKAPLLEPEETVCLLGDSEDLRHWNVQSPLLLTQRRGDDFYSVPVDLGRNSFPTCYKYGVYDLERRRFVRYEEGPNRILSNTLGADRLTIVSDGFIRLPANTWHGAGVAIPVFSLRSRKGFGVGEFSDLKSLADWCSEVGIKLIQILPVNDTISTKTRYDSYPYSAISAFALHPIYLNLGELITPVHRQALAQLERERERLNNQPALDYQAVLEAKLNFVRRIYPDQKKQTFESVEYARFFQENRDWLQPYAMFCHFRDQYKTSNFNEWPENGKYDPEELDRILEEDVVAREAASFYYFVQFHLHLQLKAATAYAHEKGVILKGDIAIGVNRYGADAWQIPDLLCMNMQAGAPPDAFAVKGQNWSFPTYNWPNMKATGFHWWKRRFAQMSRYFDAFRIDHILGFFRIWSIPLDAVEGILGYFVPARPLEASELVAHGVQTDWERLTKPLITDQVLWDLFGQEEGFIKGYFLSESSPGRYAFKPEFATQRLVEKCFAPWDQTEHNARLKLGLFDLLSNVILLPERDSPPGQFHFRFAMEQTSSFKNLDTHSQAQLKELYVDYFYRRQDEFWRREGMEKLPALKRVTNMLVCGEDLGMVPACVPEVMRQLGLLSLEIQRMPKDPNLEFFHPKDAPYLSVVTPSTHDMSTIRGWWEEDLALTQRFYNRELGFPGEVPKHCEGWINKAIVCQHLASPAMWSIFQMQDLLGTDEYLRRSNPHEERINVPAIPNYYWQFRMHVALEDLHQADGFKNSLRTWILENGR